LIAVTAKRYFNQPFAQGLYNSGFSAVSRDNAASVFGDEQSPKSATVVPQRQHKAFIARRPFNRTRLRKRRCSANGAIGAPLIIGCAAGGLLLDFGKRFALMLSAAARSEDEQRRETKYPHRHDVPLWPPDA
jgi:hypothetical protein